MTAPDRKRKWWLIPLIAVGSVFLVGSFTVQIIKAYHENRAEQEAKWWLDQAEQDAKSTWTEDDAESWLRQHGFEEVWTGKGAHQETGKPLEEFFGVMGHRLIEKGGIIVRPHTVRIQFYFDVDHRFTRVTSEAWPFDHI